MNLLIKNNNEAVCATEHKIALRKKCVEVVGLRFFRDLNAGNAVVWIVKDVPPDFIGSKYLFDGKEWEKNPEWDGDGDGKPEVEPRTWWSKLKGWFTKEQLNAK
ncbi:MAG: hypothetical protein ACXWYM_00315 [Candidatus Binatia bacterium]